MSGLLDDIEEGILHYDLSGLYELVVEQQVLMVGVILFMLGLALEGQLCYDGKYGAAYADWLVGV